MTARQSPGIERVRAGAYRVPTAGPEADGTLEWDATTIVVVQVDAGPVSGLGWTYADAACVPLIEGKLADTVTGQPVADVPACGADVPLSRLLGRVSDEVEVYGSGGFTTFTDGELAAHLTGWVHERRIPRVKIKIGESGGRETRRDVDRSAQAREVIGEEAALFVDANGAYSIGQARRVLGPLREAGVSWFEEPVSSDDLAGLAQLRSLGGPDVAAGEYGYDLPYFARMVPVVDCLQIDVTRCGGYTEWQRATALAAAANRDVSAHCAPNLSAHAGVATQNFRHIEWFADHERIENLFFDGCLDPTGGTVRPSLSASGHGLTLREDAAAEYAL